MRISSSSPAVFFFVHFIWYTRSSKFICLRHYASTSTMANHKTMPMPLIALCILSALVGRVKRIILRSIRCLFFVSTCLNIVLVTFEQIECACTLYIFICYSNFTKTERIKNLIEINVNSRSQMIGDQK